MNIKRKLYESYKLIGSLRCLGIKELEIMIHNYGGYHTPKYIPNKLEFIRLPKFGGTSFTNSNSKIFKEKVFIDT